MDTTLWEVPAPAATGRRPRRGAAGLLTPLLVLVLLASCADAPTSMGPVEDVTASVTDQAGGSATESATEAVPPVVDEGSATEPAPSPPEGGPAYNSFTRLADPILSEPSLAWRTDLSQSSGGPVDRVSFAIPPSADESTVAFWANVAVGEEQSLDRRLYVLDRESGQVRWTMERPDDLDFPGVVVIDGVVIAPTGQLGAEPIAPITGFDAVTGDPLWTVDDVRFGRPVDHPLYGPVIDGFSEVVLIDPRTGPTQRFNADVVDISLHHVITTTLTDSGFELTATSVDDGSVTPPISDPDTGGGFGSAAFVDDHVGVHFGTVFLIYDTAGELVLLDRLNGERVISLMAGPGSFVVQTIDSVFAFDPRTGDLLTWVQGAQGGASVTGGRLLVPTASGLVDALQDERLLGDVTVFADGQLLDLSDSTMLSATTLDGDPLWQIPRPAESWGEATVDDGMLIGDGTTVALYQ